jgi:hypothetical protein
MPSALHPNIGLIDRESRRFGVELGERSLNVRTFKTLYNYELSPNGPLLRCKITDDAGAVMSIEDVSVDQVIDLFRQMAPKVNARTEDFTDFTGTE